LTKEVDKNQGSGAKHVGDPVQIVKSLVPASEIKSAEKNKTWPNLPRKSQNVKA
jgi:hypothetical protein